jgi:sulfite reductase (NADPH) hemoprotein beta-component
MGPGFEPHEITDAIENVVDTYLKLRKADDESFIETYRRLGMEPFKTALYGEKTTA